MPIILSRQQLADLYRQSRGFGENALSMLTGGIAEPVAGFASLAALARGENAAGARDAVRDAFTYSPRTAEGQGQQRMLGELAQSAMNSAPVRTWQRGVDFAGRASPVAGATLQTVPAALGALTGYKQAMQTGNAISQRLAQAQRSAMDNAMVPRVLHPQRGAVLFHGSSVDADELPVLSRRKGGGFNYGAVFASGRKGAASSHGGKLYEIDIPDSDILDGGSAAYSLPAEKTQAALDDAIDAIGGNKASEHAYDAIVLDKNVGDDALRDIFGEGYDDFEYGLLQQKARASFAKRLGYKAVTTNDEHGTSYMVLPEQSMKRSISEP